MTDRPDIDALVEQTTEMGQLRRELRTEREKSSRLAERVSELQGSLDIIEAVQDARPSPPKWVARPPKRSTVTLGLMITDTHLDEVVDPDQIGRLNSYNREVAYQRLERLFTGAVTMSRDRLGFDVGGVVVFWGGDIVSGDIHQELQESNEATTVETLVHWLEPLTAGVELLASEFGRVHNVGVPGNHGRRTKKPRYKGRAADNYDTLLYHLLARQHAERQDITWQITSGIYADVQVAGLHVRMEHGDEARGGTGISSAMSPLLLLQHRRSRQYAESGRPLDLLMLGHFHARYSAPGLIVGGSLKGPDEYSTGRGFGIDPASQELLIFSDGRVVLNAPIWVADPHPEGWG